MAMEVTPQVQVEKGSNLIVNYIPNDLSDEDFHDLFSKVGPIYSAKVSVFCLSKCSSVVTAAHRFSFFCLGRVHVRVNGH